MLDPTNTKPSKQFGDMSTLVNNELLVVAVILCHKAKLFDSLHILFLLIKLLLFLLTVCFMLLFLSF